MALKECFLSILHACSGIGREWRGTTDEVFVTSIYYTQPSVQTKQGRVYLFLNLSLYILAFLILNWVQVKNLQQLMKEKHHQCKLQRGTSRSGMQQPNSGSIRAKSGFKAVLFHKLHLVAAFCSYLSPG